ncbi:hypothetical protein GCM10009119_06110 [Algoriphagus jejuensis]|uniref:Schlafen AlbA-2 domain-containing protein n=1 Tax=Algoriphagus jejuensis TaxID=419934 RepID=A0ABN1MWS6_9BACT
MTLSEVKALTAKGEGLKIEFKKKAAFPEKIVREVIAFANTEGGDLLIGVDDDGTVSGQRYIEEEIFVMEKAIRELIFPALEVPVFSVKLSEKKGVAIFRIPKSPERPYYLREKGRKQAYIRVQDHSVQASREVWEILRKGRVQKDTIFTYGWKEEILMKAVGEKREDYAEGIFKIGQDSSLFSLKDTCQACGGQRAHDPSTGIRRLFYGQRIGRSIPVCLKNPAFP